METNRTTWKRHLFPELAFVFACFLTYFIWSLVLPYDTGPDEYARYDIPLYIYRYGVLPAGNEAELIIPGWGFSYGYTPYLAYIFGALFMKIHALAGAAEANLLYAARLVSVLSSTITAWFALKIGRKLFDGATRWLFAVLVAFLPQFIFISAYVNNDAFAIMSTAIIVYFWIDGLRSGWRPKSAIGLAVGLALCLLSYYNAYGYVLSSVIVVAVSLIRRDWDPAERRFSLRPALITAGQITVIVLVLAGWWFIRSYLLHGDLLGLKTMARYSELYGFDRYKPSRRATPQRNGESLLYMLIGRRWIYWTAKSFIGIFDYMTLFLKRAQYILYTAVLGAGLTLNLGGQLEAVGRSGRTATAWMDRHATFTLLPAWIFKALMLVNIAIPIALSVYYSYTSDFQAQGRYLLPALIPLMYVVAGGYDLLRFRGKEKPAAADRAIAVIALAYAVAGVWILASVVIPHYAGYTPPPSRVLA